MRIPRMRCALAIGAALCTVLVVSPAQTPQGAPACQEFCTIFRRVADARSSAFHAIAGGKGAFEYDTTLALPGMKKCWLAYEDAKSDGVQAEYHCQFEREQWDYVEQQVRAAEPDWTFQDDGSADRPHLSAWQPGFDHKAVNIGGFMKFWEITVYSTQ